MTHPNDPRIDEAWDTGVEQGTILILPDGSIDLMETPQGLWVVGPMTRARRILLDGGKPHRGIRWVPGTLPATALKWPLQALRNRVVPLDALMDNAPRGLEEGWERCNASPFMDELAATTTLLQHAPNTSITELAAHVGWSDRTLRRRFTQGLGLPPKTFAQIQRLQWVVHHLRQEPHSALASLALKCGYADQAHLSNDVRRFTGLTPTKLRRLVADSFKIHPPTSPYPHR